VVASNILSTVRVTMILLLAVVAPLRAQGLDAGMIDEPRAVLVSTPSQCETLLDFLHVFERGVRLRVRLDAIMLRDRSELEALRRVQSLFPLLPVKRLSESVSRMYKASFKPSTPVLVVYSAKGRVRMILAAPVTVRDADLFVRWLQVPR
jgi:hypothetical protein